jgi:hypothetical protein
MRYYTKEQASKKATKENDFFNRDNNPPFYRSLMNIVRMHFGLEPKLFYFEPKHEIHIKRVGVINQRGEYIPLTRVYDDAEPDDLEKIVYEDKDNFMKGGFI